MPKKPILRSCAICREKKEKNELLRIVRLPEGTVEVDPSGKKPGRGAYICKNEKCIKNAQKHHRLDGALKTVVPDDVYEQAMEYSQNEQ